jgi:hypothetical protein
MKTIELGDVIRDGESIMTVTNLIDAYGDQTEDGSLAVSVVAKGDDGWYVFEIDQLQYRLRH